VAIMSFKARRRSPRSCVVLLAATLIAALAPLLGEAAPFVPPARAATLPASGSGYWLVASDGGVFSYGDAAFHGSSGAIKLNQPIVGMAPTRTAGGYWQVASDGGIFSYGDAAFFGSTGAIRLNRPIVGMAATNSGHGYWLVASDGGIFAFGDAAFHGSTGAISLNKPIVGMTPTPTGAGYWLVASDGGIFAFGDAAFHGSTGAMRLNQSIAGMAATPTGAGYWLVASDGGTFAFGNAPFLGAAPERPARPGETRRITAMVPTATGRGYWQMSTTGEVLAFGDGPNLGGPTALNRPLVAMAAAPGTGDEGQQTGPGQTQPVPTTATTTPPGPGLLTPAQKGRPNIMVVVMDDLRDEGVMDVPEVLPKTKQWLAAGGTTFSEGVATTPLCCPERAAIWSGRLSHNTGVFNNDTPTGGPAGTGDELDRDWVIPRYLNDAGYRTALVGKWLTNWKFRYDIPHFQDYAAFQGGYTGGVPFRVKDPGDSAYHSENVSAPADSDSDYSTDYIGQKVVEYISAYEANDDQPWYIHVTPHAPHDDTTEPWFKWPERHNDLAVPSFRPSPANTVEGAPAEKRDKVKALQGHTMDPAKVRTYHDGMLKTLLAADEMIDNVMKTLEAKGELDNTLVIFTSDNGFSWGERGVESKGWPYREHISVPFLVRWPSVVPVGAVDQRPVGGEDILPTLLEAAQYSPPQLGYPLDGKSFLPGNPGKAYKYLEFGPRPGPAPAGYTGNHKGIPTWAALRTPTWHYIEYYDESDHATVTFREYYDLTSDPWELQNLLAANDPAGPANDPDVGTLSAQLEGLRTCSGTSGANPCP
jgi:arylsulfatase A-like enzyme